MRQMRQEHGIVDSARVLGPTQRVRSLPPHAIYIGIFIEDPGALGVDCAMKIVRATVKRERQALLLVLRPVHRERHCKPAGLDEHVHPMLYSSHWRTPSITSRYDVWEYRATLDVKCLPMPHRSSTGDGTC